jgi:thiol-disulfide isomerase/thioredoxin
MSTTPNNSRRNLLIAAGVGAAALGTGLAWRNQQSAGPVSAQAQAFWEARFETLEGAELVSASLRGKPLILNFWASWCAPCVKELPEIAQFARETPQWQVLGLAVDSKAAVQAFLKKLPVDLHIALAGLTGTDLARQLGNTQGGLPFSVAFNVDGEVIWQKLGSTNLTELRNLARQHA